MNPITMCHTFIAQADRTWGIIDDGVQFGIPIGEESLTDLNLLEIARAHPGTVHVRKYSRKSEARVSGADWEWWLGGASGWVGLRIQAKKLDVGKRSIRGIDHVNRHGRQIDLLINSSRADGVYPIYCFYAAWSGVQQWNCQTFPTASRLLGCTVVPAQMVLGLLTNQSTLAQLSSVVFPWSCLVCCVGASGPGRPLAERVDAFLRQVMQVSEAPEIHTAPPAYVAALLGQTDFVGVTADVRPDLSNILIVEETGA